MPVGYGRGANGETSAMLPECTSAELNQGKRAEHNQGECS